MNVSNIIAAALIAIGIAVGGWFAGDALVRGRAAARYVTVKGVAEREVQANLALWPIQFVVAENDLARAQVLSAESTKKVMAFLKRQGIEPAQILLSSEGPWSGGPTYLFTKLNDVKPAMLAQATANAREAAAQFAKDAGSRLGGIRQANQGLFVILPRDQAPGVEEQRQRTKVVRVVSTVDYLLRD